MKETECIIHFSNYLMEQEDTTRMNALSSDMILAGFNPMGPLIGRQSYRVSHTTITKPRGLWRRDMAGQQWVGPGTLRMCSEELQLHGKRACPSPVTMLQAGEGLGSVGIPEEHEVSMSSHGRLQTSVALRQLPGC